MQLKNIDKLNYRKNMNLVLVIFFASMAVLAIILGKVLILAFGNTDIVVGESTGNTPLNFLGVIIAAMVCFKILQLNKRHPVVEELFYIWDLKKLQNKIYRKINPIQTAADQDDPTAILILTYYYQSLSLVYQLDNNTLTMENVLNQQQKLTLQAESLNLNIDISDFNEQLLDTF